MLIVKSLQNSRIILPFGMFLLCIILNSQLKAQSNYQNIYGKIMDSESGEALIGASIVVLNIDPIVGATTDLEGNYLLNQIPVGRLNIQVSYIGYESQQYEELLLNSGKALNLDIKLRESLNSLDEITVSGTKKEESMLHVKNEMATVSAMSYSLEQSTRYAGSNNDPSRLVLSFPGVRNQGDIQNGISIRGNTPTALMWSIEGLELQSPNHFAREGSLGAVNMISSNLMQSVEFYTAAFPAQYANAGSGVFDIKYRKGNPEEYEFSLSAGTLGVEASAEGPFSKKYKGSFLLSYRYSTLGILSKLGYAFGGNNGPIYQDFNYKMHLPTKNLGTFQIFGLLGDSYIRPIEIVDEDWTDEYRLSVVGLKNTKRVSDKTFLQSALMYTQSRGFFAQNWQNDRYSFNEMLGQQVYQGYTVNSETFPIIEKRLQLDLKTNTKVSARHSFQSGLNVTYLDFSQEFTRQKDRYNYSQKGDSLFLKRTTVDSSQTYVKTFQIKAFMQHKYRVNDALSFTGGLSFTHLNFTKFLSIEPRIGMEYLYGKGHKFTAGAGLHSRLESLAYYGSESKYWELSSEVDFMGNPRVDQKFGAVNKNLGATRSVHLVAGSSLTLFPKLIFKGEIYFQYLYNIPIDKYNFNNFDYASINFQYPSIYNYDFEYQLVYANKGKGLNYGIDLSLEKSFAKQYYFLINASYYQSKYRTPFTQENYNLKWLNTRYNGNFIFTITAGKDIQLGKHKNNILGLNFRSIYAGNNRIMDSNIYQAIPFENRLSNYFRIDTRVAYTRNKSKYAWTLSLDMQNVTNRINESSNPQINSAGILPYLNYKVDF